MVILIEKQGEFPNKSFKSVATKAWNEFFKKATEEMDLAHWVIEADSGTVQLTGRITSVDESSPDWEPPVPILASVDGIVESFEMNPYSSEDQLRNHFQQWAQEGILDSFHSATVIKKFERFNPKSNTFAIVTSLHDEGLHEDDLSIIWSNDKSLSAEKIKTRQKKARSKSPKRIVKKKRLKKR